LNEKRRGTPAAFFCIYETPAPAALPRHFFDYSLRGSGGPHSLRHGL